jgi:hypothetical protein
MLIDAVIAVRKAALLVDRSDGDRDLAYRDVVIAEPTAMNLPSFHL